MTYHPHPLAEPLSRIADALERICPKPLQIPDFNKYNAFIWSAPDQSLLPLTQTSAIDLSLLHGIEHVRGQLIENTINFAQGFPANNTLLWGARGTGKSSLIKAIHAEIANTYPLKIVEIPSEYTATLPALMATLKDLPYRFILFCDDLSFDGQDSSYRALKSVLDGGLEGRPANILLYATSNRRHLMPRDMIENERSTAIHPNETVEEKVSLSDRFGLWLGFHPVSQDDFLAMVFNYVDYFQIPADSESIRKDAIEWAATRGSRSGRVAWQFIQHLAGQYKIALL